jgi:uncharacterized membrane protein
MSDLETEKKILEHYKNNFNRKSKKLEDIIYNENNKNLKGKFVNVYVPTTPNPTSGYTLIVPIDKVINLDLSVDQVLKYVISTLHR